ncbi:MAG: hypothetical protein EXS46_01450 [Candidatus Taylorbacteria bacterium]|nr:hypothetical protein [Candidatus Taylorbacteria bacterium]
MKNSSEVSPFDSGAREVIEEVKIPLEVLPLNQIKEVEAESESGLVGQSEVDDLLLGNVRKNLKEKGFVPLYPPEKEFIPLQNDLQSGSFESKRINKTLLTRFRRWAVLGLATLGLIGGEELHAEDVKAHSKNSSGGVPIYKVGDKVPSGTQVNKVPIFQAEAQPASTNKFVYGEEAGVWKPTTEKDFENAAKARKWLEERAQAESQALKTPGYSVQAATNFNQSTVPQVEVANQQPGIRVIPAVTQTIGYSSQVVGGFDSAPVVHKVKIFPGPQLSQTITFGIGGVSKGPGGSRDNHNGPRPESKGRRPGK